MSETTPTRDEAVPRNLLVLHEIARIRALTLPSRFVEPEDISDYAREVVRLRASAPAPASGGVDAAFTVASNLLRDGCTYVDRKAAADFIRAALSPAATPVSEAPAFDICSDCGGAGESPDGCMCRGCGGGGRTLAKPASEPAGGGVRFALEALCDAWDGRNNGGYYKGNVTNATANGRRALSSSAPAEAERELGAISGHIGRMFGARFMDPPDGGDVSLSEQVRRMCERLKELEAPSAQNGKTCYNTGLSCLAGCDGKNCAGLHVPLDKWPQP
jgi:hypothetical protein